MLEVPIRLQGLSQGTNMMDQARALVYRLKITLVGLEPPVWRRVLVPGDTNLGSLHRAIQYVMGWSNSHLHIFHVGKTRIAPRTPDWDDVEDERKFMLWDIAHKTGAKLFYEYDMGDSWGHEVKVEAITPATAAFKGPECLAGAGACPPEDCGGIGGYEDLLAALRDTLLPKLISGEIRVDAKKALVGRGA
ncbi:MAG: IS1096 element passenger TnpR family protein [Elusimicrobiota bacterium]